MLQIQDQSLRHVATAHLAQTMSLLALSNQELQEKVLEELAENPALELLEDLVCPICKKRLPAHGPCPKCSSPQAGEDSVVFISPRDGGGSLRYEDNAEELEPAAPESLALHVLEQLAAELDVEDRPIAAYFLSSLDDDGSPVVIQVATACDPPDTVTFTLSVDPEPATCPDIGEIGDESICSIFDS